MDIVVTPYALTSAAASVVAACVAAVAWRRRDVAGGTTLALLMAAVAEWSLGAAVEYAAVGVAAKVLLSKIEYLGAVTAPVFLLLFALEHGRRDRWLTRRTILPLFVVPLLTLGLAATNERHGLIWSGFAPSPAGHNLLIYRHGPWYWVGVVGYSYLALLTGTALLVQAAARFPAAYRRQTAALLAGLAVPWVGDLCYNAGLVPIPGLEVTPLLLTVTGVVLLGTIFGFRLFDVVPVAREALIETMPDGVLALDARGRVADINPAARRLLAVPAGDGPGRPAEAILASWPGLARWVRDNPAGARGGEVSLDDFADRHLEVSAAPLRDRRGRETGRLLVLRDVTGRRRAEADLRQALARQQAQLMEIELLQAELREQAIRDSLTGLFNRRLLDEALERELRVAGRDGEPVGLVVLDLDHFKRLNDTHGHQAGDAVLAAFGRFLGARARPGDTVCRFGGEEFVAILPGAGAEAAWARAEEWRAAWAEVAVPHGGESLRGTLSSGVAAFPAHGTTPVALLAAGDLALYDAKAGGRNRVSLCQQRFAQAA